MAELRPVDELTDEEFDAEFAKLENMPEEDEVVEDTAESTESEEEVPAEDAENEDEEVEEPEEDNDSESEDEPEEDDNPEDEESEEQTEEESDDTESTNEEQAAFDFTSIPMDETMPMDIQANGMNVKASMNELVAGFQKGMNYTQKMQALSGHSKDMGIMKDNGLSTEDLNLLVEAKNGNKDALAKLMSNAKVDPLDLEEAKVDYTPQDHGKAPLDFEMEQVKESIVADTEYSGAVQKAVTDMPDDMYEVVSQNAGNLNALYQDVKAGIYQEVMPEVMKLQTLYGKTAPTMEMYMKVAEARQKRLADTAGEPKQETVKEVKDTKRKVNRKRAASSSKPNKAKVDVVEDINDLDDDEFMKAFEKMTGRKMEDD